jgi:dTDP-4-dehydrorhamnose reductase
MRILIIGASGMLGADLQKEWTGDELIPASSRDADIRDIAQVRALLSRSKPDWIVLAAAYTDVDGSERSAELAMAVNGQGTENVARAAQEIGAKLFYISTDYLYDGQSNRPYEPADPIAPLNVYGQSKAAGEKAVQTYAKGWCIARTSWLFGAAGASFPEKILKAAETRPELTVVADQTGSPTFTRDLAGAIRDLIRQDARGIINITNSGSCTWCEFAAEVLRQAGRTAVRVLPITTAQAARLAKRPAYSVLAPTSLHARGLILQSWQKATTAYLRDLRDCGKLK